MKRSNVLRASTTLFLVSLFAAFLGVGESVAQKTFYVDVLMHRKLLILSLLFILPLMVGCQPSESPEVAESVQGIQDSDDEQTVSPDRDPTDNELNEYGLVVSVEDDITAANGKHVEVYYSTRGVETITYLRISQD
ncbi:hypothetical protein HQ496_06340 [bacterium]|nr:hypothetical protein [bacterium]